MTRPRILQKSADSIRQEMERMGVDPAGIEIMTPKARHLAVQLGQVDLKAALILKQDLLSLGGDAALTRKAASLKLDKTPVLLLGTLTQLNRLSEKLRGQPFGLSQLASELKETLKSLEDKPVFVAGGVNLLEKAPVSVMGILNITPDSFSDGGRYMTPEKATDRAMEMIEEGAGIIDVGGESSRPGARPVDEETEGQKVLPVIEAVRSRWEGPISIDTTKSAVASRALAAGATILNDISGMTFDEAMPETAARASASVILMHTRGRPAVMQEDLHYDDLVAEVYEGLERFLKTALAAGISRDRICLDPGIGFGKTFEHNLALLNRLSEFASLGCAIMVGASRKAFIGHYLNADVDDRVEGSLAGAVTAVLRGASLIRAHDIRQTARAVRMAYLIRESAQ